MAKLSSLKAAFRRKKGFSLIVVMILSLVNLAIMGVALQFAVSSSGGGRVNSAMAAKYNLLQNALEDGKARLKKSMDNDGPPHSYLHNGIDTSTITSPDMLLLIDRPATDVYTNLDDSDFNLGTITQSLLKSDLERIGIFGDSGELTVKIYDMLYDPGSVAIKDAEYLRLMPPAMSLPGDEEENTVWDLEDVRSAEVGVYLIRAALSVYDNNNEVHDTDDPIHTWSLETSVVQANR
jgi:hypothetical protein